jgi:hypothetical protein
MIEKAGIVDIPQPEPALPPGMTTTPVGEAVA